MLEATDLPWMKLKLNIAARARRYRNKVHTLGCSTGWEEGCFKTRRVSAKVCAIVHDRVVTIELIRANQ